jgi:hypothetical protein
MTVTIRELQDAQGEYFAYTKSLCGKATYFVYLRDDIFGAVALVNFVQMLRCHFDVQSVEVKVLDSSIQPKNPLLLEVLRQREGPGECLRA